MKLKLIILTLTFISFNYTFSQAKELYIEYDFYFKDKLVENKRIHLRSTTKESLNKVIRTIMVHYPNESKPHTSYKYIYKSYSTNSLQYNEDTPGKGGNVFVNETLNQFNWKLTGKRKTILKYNCQEATTTYRGRDYVAYFTTELPYKAAPWKFHGLPGVMLEVKTTDEKIKMEAKILKVQTSTEAIKNPFIKVKEFITSWGDFKELYKKRLEQSINRNISNLSTIKMSSEDRARIGIGGVDMRVEIIVSGNGIPIKEQLRGR